MFKFKGQNMKNSVIYFLPASKMSTFRFERYMKIYYSEEPKFDIKTEVYYFTYTLGFLKI